MSGHYERCELCPRRCGVSRAAGQLGVCGAPSEVRAARAAPHFGEEPCISGVRGAGTIFFSGCTLRCVYCQNAEISLERQGYALTIGQLAQAICRLAAQGVHNISMVTTTQYAPQVIEAVAMSRRAGMTLPVLYNCGGYERVETVAMLNGTVDVWMPDYKYADPVLAKRYSGAADYPETALQAIDKMLEQAGAPVFDSEGMLTKGVLIRHLLLPGQLADSMRVVKTLWERYGDEVLLSLMSQYTPMPRCAGDPLLSRRINPRHYEALVDYAASLGVTRCYIQQPDADGVGAIPAFDGTGLPFF